MFNWAAHISKTKSKSMLSSSTFGSRTKAPHPLWDQVNMQCLQYVFHYSLLQNMCEEAS